MKTIYRYKDNMYLSRGGLISSNKLNRLDVKLLDDKNGIEEFELIVPAEYDPLFHKLNFNNGTVFKDKYTINLIDHEVSVGMVDGLPVFGPDIPPNTYTVPVPQFLVKHIDGSWEMEKGRIVPTNLTVFKGLMIEVIGDLVKDLRNVAVKFKSVEERLLFVAYGEAALRIINGVPYGDDMSLFEAEANISGENTMSLVNRTSEKYIKYILVNRTLTVGLKVSSREITKASDYTNTLSLLTQARRDIQDRFNSQTK